jgi:hypothetical protein
MSKATWMAYVCAAIVAGCATGTQGFPADSSVSIGAHHDDGHNNVTVDAPTVRMDANIDAFVQEDAPSSPGSCSANSDCTVAGQCCVILGASPGICTMGIIINAICIPT